MMNLEKMKHGQKKTAKSVVKKTLLVLASTMCLTAPLYSVHNAFAEGQAEAVAGTDAAEAQSDAVANTENAEGQAETAASAVTASGSENPEEQTAVENTETAANTETGETTEVQETASNENAETNAEPSISIEKPEGWRQGDTTIAIKVDASQMPEGFSIAKIEAKAGEDGSWQDITETGSITINGNQTIYVRVTDGNGKVYEQNRSVKCYDDEKPTLSASLTNGLLTIQGNDTVSGISAITVNGTTYTDLTDGMLRIQLTQDNFKTKQIEITATDGSGNTSEKYILQNPYYEWAVQQAEQNQSTGNTSTGLLSTTDSTGTSASTTSSSSTRGTENTTISPLPQEAQASEPTTATGTVDERTVTGIEEELAANGETAETVTSTGTQDTKEFYTISTKSGKNFYLIVDNSKSSDNVYFLTEVSEKDLMNFTLSDTVTLPSTETVYAVPESQLAADSNSGADVNANEDDASEDTETPEVDPEMQMPEDKSPVAAYLLIGLIAVGTAAGGYYFKIYKPKHEYDDEDEYEDDEEDFEEPTEQDDVEEESEGVTDPGEDLAEDLAEDYEIKSKEPADGNTVEDDTKYYESSAEADLGISYEADHGTEIVTNPGAAYGNSSDSEDELEEIDFLDDEDDDEPILSAETERKLSKFVDEVLEDEEENQEIK